MKQYLGIDIGGTSIKYGLYNAEGDALQEGRETPSTNGTFDEMLAILYDIIRQFPAIDGIGVSVPGGVHKDTGIIIEGGACEALAEKDLRLILQEKFGLPVSIGNDANCAILAELWRGNGRGCKHFICVTVGTGIGGAIVIDGKLYWGAHSHSGEFGFMLQHNGKQHEALHDTAATTSFLQRLRDETDTDIHSGSDLFAALDDANVKKMYDAWVEQLARGIYNIAVCFDPEKILLGGGVSAQARLIADLNTALENMKEFPFHWAIESCFFRNDAGKIGAIYQLLHEPGKLNSRGNCQ